MIHAVVDRCAPCARLDRQVPEGRLASPRVDQRLDRSPPGLSQVMGDDPIRLVNRRDIAVHTLAHRELPDVLHDVSTFTTGFGLKFRSSRAKAVRPRSTTATILLAGSPRPVGHWPSYVGGRSPDSRVVAFACLPRASDPSGRVGIGSLLTVAGGSLGLGTRRGAAPNSLVHPVTGNHHVQHASAAPGTGPGTGALPVVCDSGLRCDILPPAGMFRRRSGKDLRGRHCRR